MTSSHAYSQEHEADIARMLTRRGFAAKPQPGSGNKDHSPNDVLCNEADLMVECKLTAKHSMAVQLDWLDRVADKAMQFLKRGVVAIRFAAPWPAKPKDYVLMDVRLFMHLLECERQVGKCVCKS